jgi:hypothetical protein
MPFQQEEDGLTRRYDELLLRLRHAVLKGPGRTDPSLRLAVKARASALGGWEMEAAGSVPDEIAVFVDKVAVDAYKVTDPDVERLRAAGYSEQEIFEVTVCAALGAAMGRLRRGLDALDKAS